MDDHQEWQDKTQEHQDHTETEKKTGRINHNFLNREGREAREEKR